MATNARKEWERVMLIKKIIYNFLPPSLFSSTNPFVRHKIFRGLVGHTSATPLGSEMMLNKYFLLTIAFLKWPN